MERILGDYQAGFRKNRSTLDQIFILRQSLEKFYEYDKQLHQLYVDFKQAYDSLDRGKIYKIMREFGIPSKLIRLTEMTLKGTVCKVRVEQDLSESF